MAEIPVTYFEARDTFNRLCEDHPVVVLQDTPTGRQWRLKIVDSLTSGPTYEVWLVEANGIDCKCMARFADWE